MDDQVIIKMSTDWEMTKFDGEAGNIAAYISTFNNTDKVGDIMAPGAFSKFVEDFEKVEGNKLPMLFQHSQLDVVGEWTRFEINSRGIKGFGTIYTETSKGSDARALIMRGMVGSTSIGFRSKNFENLESGGRLFKEVTLVETSLVLTPANPKAKITSVKTADNKIDIRLVEKYLREVGLNSVEAKILVSKAKDELRDVIDAEDQKRQLVSNLTNLLK